jgi:hypothetical protein
LEKTEQFGKNETMGKDRAPACGKTGASTEK